MQISSYPVQHRWIYHCTRGLWRRIECFPLGAQLVGLWIAHGWGTIFTHRCVVQLCPKGPSYVLYSQTMVLPNTGHRAIERMGNTINYYIFSKNLKIIINNQSCLKLTKLVDTESAAGAYSSCGGMRRSFLQIANSTGVLVSLNWHTRSERL